METKQTDIKLKPPIRCIVKLGGAAITCKNDFEKINESNLVTVTLHRVDDIKEQQVLDYNGFVVIHGAGSFGHFQASKSSVHRGGLNQPLVKAGFVATRISRVFHRLQCDRKWVHTYSRRKNAGGKKGEKSVPTAPGLDSNCS